MRINGIVIAVCVVLASPAKAQDTVEVFVPPALTSSDVEAVKQSLSLSEAQRAVIDRLHVTYLDEWNALQEQAVPAVRAAGFEAGPLFMNADGQFGQQAVDAFAKVEALRGDLLARCKKIDEAFWRQVQPLLAEDQAARLTRIAHHRDRDRSHLTNRLYPGARVDLVRVLRLLKIEIQPSSELDIVLEGYDAAIGPLWLELDQALARNEVACLQAAVDLLFNPVVREGQDSNAAYTAKIRELSRSAVRLEKRIAALNRTFLPQVVGSLSSNHAQSVLDASNRASFPQIYPDPYDPREVFHRLMAKELPSDLRTLLIGVWTEYRQAYEVCCKAMERAECDHWEEFELTRGMPGAGEYQELMGRLREERWQKNKTVVERLNSCLPEGIASEIRVVLDDYFQRAERHRRALQAVGRRE